MLNNYIGERIETHSSEQVSELSVNESVSCLQQRVFVKEQQQNYKLFEKLKDFLRFERQTVRSEIFEMRNPSSTLIKSTNDCSIAGLQTTRMQSNEQLRNRVQQLEKEIESLHSSYKKKCEQQAIKADEKNEFFMHLIDQIHGKHSEQVEYYQNVITEFQQERGQIGNIELKMNQIGNGIQDILKQSSELTRRNEQLELRIIQQDQLVLDLRKELERCREVANVYHSKADEYQKIRLRGLKYQRDITELLDEADLKIHQTPKQHGREPTIEVCMVTGAATLNCPHCRLTNMQNKYSKMLNQS